MRDLREYARQTNIRLIIGVISITLVLGTGLILLIYGPGAASLGFLCLLGAGIPIGLIILLMLFLDFIIKKHQNL